MADRLANYAFAKRWTLRACLGAREYLTIVALLGVALGFLLRSTAAGIVTLVGIVLILWLLARA